MRDLACTVQHTRRSATVIKVFSKSLPFPCDDFGIKSIAVTVVLTCFVLIKNVVLVPNETMASSARSGKARIVDGLSPVNGMMSHSFGKP